MNTLSIISGLALLFVIIVWIPLGLIGFLKFMRDSHWVRYVAWHNAFEIIASILSIMALLVFSLIGGIGTFLVARRIFKKTV